MTDKQINKWLRHRFTGIGWALIAFYILMNLLAVLGMMTDVVKQALEAFASGTFFEEPDMASAANNAWGYIVTIGVSLAILHAWKGPDYWKTEILAKEDKMRPGVFFCLLSLCVGAQMVNTLWISLLEAIMNSFGMSVMNLLESVAGDSGSVSMFLYASILAPISEEIIFRGCILRTLKPFGKRFAIFGSALLFGLFHGNLLQTPYAFLVGLVLGYVTVEYSIGWAIAIHMFNNLVLADLLTRLTANLPEIAQGILNLGIFGGFLLISVGILIAKRQEIRAYIQSEWMDRRVLKCFFTNPGILALTAVMVINMVLMLFV